MIERTADDLDMAGQLQDLFNADGLALSREALRPQTPAGTVVTECIECGADLPQVRIEYKWVRCTPCQTDFEHQQKQRGRR